LKSYRNYSPEAPYKMTGEGVLVNALEQVLHLFSIRFLTCKVVTRNLEFGFRRYGLQRIYIVNGETFALNIKKQCVVARRIIWTQSGKVIDNCSQCDMFHFSYKTEMVLFSFSLCLLCSRSLLC
jgi:hypothetical protein